VQVAPRGVAALLAGRRLRRPTSPSSLPTRYFGVRFERRWKDGGRRGMTSSGSGCKAWG
jgi:hypothetical protein